MMPRLYLMIGMASTLCLTACLTVPKELVDARAAFARASNGPAPQLSPTELRLAREALAQAEESYKQKPDSYVTRDLAYVAERSAQLAEVKASAADASSKAAKAIKDYQATQNEIIRSEREKLAAEKQKLSDEQQKVNQLQTDLEKLGSVVRETRGMVLTLSGSVLFASGKSTLLPSAQERLNQVAEALMQNKNRKLIVEGHTDTQGSATFNQELSQRRADAVKSYLVSRGYPEELIVAEGKGEEHSIASNETAEGRANNRRVEIIIQPVDKD